MRRVIYEYETSDIRFIFVRRQVISDYLSQSYQCIKEKKIDCWQDRLVSHKQRPLKKTTYYGVDPSIVNSGLGI